MTTTNEQSSREQDEFAMRLSDYAVAVHHQQSEKAKVLADVLKSMFEARVSTALELLQPKQTDGDFVRMLLWDEFPECCGCPVVGAEYMGQQEQVCCGNPEPALLNDAQIVASLRERFPEALPPTAITAEEAGREGEAKDGARLDWLEQQDLNDLSTIRQTNDVVGIHVGHGPYYGKTLRAAIDAAMLPPAPAQSGGQG